MIAVHIFIGIIAGFLGAIGVGGGSVLILYLTLFLQMPQLQAQGINLLFFIPCSIVGLIFHIKNHLVNFKLAVPLIVTGFTGVLCGYFLNARIDESILRKIFGIFILILAVSQVYSALKQKKAADYPPLRKNE